MSALRCPKNTCMLLGRCSYPTYCSATGKPPWTWSGPRADEVDAAGFLTREVPTDRWPYGPPEFHEGGCMLKARGAVAGSFCDCRASCADDDEWGAGA